MRTERSIFTDVEKCVGCRTCELSCSLSKTDTFDPSKSRIKVYRNVEDGTVEITVSTHCDGCFEKKIPLCVKLCSSGCLGLEAK